MSEKKNKNVFKQLVVDGTVEFATLIHRLDLANSKATKPDSGFKELSFSAPLANGQYLHIDLKVNEDKGMVKG